MDDKNRPAEVIVLRCESCGDTFPTEAPAAAACPSCGSRDVHPATEPLL